MSITENIQTTFDVEVPAKADLWNRVHLMESTADGRAPNTSQGKAEQVARDWRLARVIKVTTTTHIEVL